MGRSKRDMLKELDDVAYGQDEDGHLIDIEDFKDLMFDKWINKATRTLRRIPEYRWLFREDAPDWWTVEQVAEHMGVPKKTVYNWCKEIIGVRLGEGKAGYRLPRSGLIIFLADLDEEPPELAPDEIEEMRTANQQHDEEPPDQKSIASFEEYVGNREAD